MFSEVLKIKPQLDSSDASKMERNLTQRFGKISKKFAKGLGAALLGGGVTGLALGLIEKLLNPLKETQETIDKMLKQGDDIVTNAKQFGTTAGKLFKLQQLAKSTGLDPDALFMAMNKFQVAVAEAKADPTKQTSVRKFVDKTDTADAFFEFIQGLQVLGKQDKGKELLVQQEVFGEKQILKMADFLQTDFSKQMGKVGLLDSEAYTPSLEKLGGLNDRKDELAAGNEAIDMVNKASVINAGMIGQQAMQQSLQNQRETERISAYKQLADINRITETALAVLEKGALDLVKILSNSANLSSFASQLSVSRIFRGILGGGKDK